MRRRWTKFLDTLSDLAFIVIVLLPWLAAVVILGTQAYSWAYTGTWPPFHAEHVLLLPGVDTQPIYHPTEWVGLASIVQWLLDLPLALWLFVLPVVIWCGLAD